MCALHHITDADLDRLQLHLMASVELYVVEEHLLWCTHCTDRAAENMKILRTKGHAHLDHLSIDDLERFVAGGIDDAVVASRVEQHVRACQFCSDRVVAIERFLSIVQAGRLTKGYATQSLKDNRSRMRESEPL